MFDSPGPCLIDAELVPKDFTFTDDIQCPMYGIGLTNIVARTTRSSSDLSRLVYFNICFYMDLKGYVTRRAMLQS